MFSDTKLEACLQEMQEGREEAYVLFVDRFWEPVARIATRFCRSESDTEEWTELILLHAIDRILKGRVSFISDTALKNWLFRIATRKCIEFWRREKSSHEYTVSHEKLDRNPHPTMRAPSSLMELGELRRAVKEAIQRIPKSKLRKTIQLAWIDGLSFEEIAKKLGKSQNTVRTWERRGRVALRSVLEKNYAELIEEYGVGANK